MHTVFSDGTVWPTVRIDEAWQEGLDAIAITDHIEYRPHSKEINADHNRSYEIARPLAQQRGIILIHGAEITRDMPPGHINALFIKNANLLEREDVYAALQEARDQGAFLVWNHPGWKAQQPDTTQWFNEHTTLLKQHLLHGIEVFNDHEYYPEALLWAKEKKLSVLSCSDVHGPMYATTTHRPMTLVFAQQKTASAIKEALFARRTVAYFGNQLAGPADLLEALFFKSLQIDKQTIQLKNGISEMVLISNNSDIDYRLKLAQPCTGADVPEELILKAHHITPLTISGNSDELNSIAELTLYYAVTNLHAEPDANPIITFTFKNVP